MIRSCSFNTPSFSFRLQARPPSFIILDYRAAYMRSNILPKDRATLSRLIAGTSSFLGRAVWTGGGGREWSLVVRVSHSPAIAPCVILSDLKSIDSARYSLNTMVIAHLVLVDCCKSSDLFPSHPTNLPPLSSIDSIRQTLTLSPRSTLLAISILLSPPNLLSLNLQSSLPSALPKQFHSGKSGTLLWGSLGWERW